MSIKEWIFKKPEKTGAVTGVYSGFGSWTLFGGLDMTTFVEWLQVGTTIISFLIALVSFYVLLRKHFDITKKFPFIKFDDGVEE